MRDKRKNTPQGIQSVENAFLILDTIKKNPDPLTLSDVSRMTNMSKSRVQKYIISLLKLNVLDRNEKDFTYSFGSKLLEIGLHAFKSYDIIEISGRYLKQIRKQLKQTSALNIWTHNGPVVVKSEPSGAPVSVDIQIGYQPPILKSATGKCFAAFKDSLTIQSLIDAEIVKYKLNEDMVKEELKEIKENGYSYRKATHKGVPGGVAITCPVFNSSGEILAVLSVIGFSDELNTAPNSKEVKTLKEIAHNLSNEIH